MQRIAYLLILVIGLTAGCDRASKENAKLAPVPAPTAVAKTKVKINEAARTLLYLPLYHAQRQGYFTQRNLEVEIVTGGTATASFAALTSGEADFSQADPMYVPIAREKNGAVKVVAQVVARIALWGTTNNPAITTADRASLRGKRIATHQRPMTAFTYTEKYLRELGLDPDKDVEMITGKPGTELSALLANQADFMMSIEPATSQAVAKGGRVVYSLPARFGDQIFTALMTREDFLKDHGPTARAVVAAYQAALDDMHARPAEAARTAREYFPTLEPAVLTLAIERLLADEVWPKFISVSKESWDKAVAVRVQAGDLKAAAPLEDCVADIR